MSRLIVKNLPDKIKENKLKELFSSQGGEITDIKLCFTKEGAFRKFGFIGYKSKEDAGLALNYFNKTFIGTSKVQVEICKDLGDQTVTRPWSKYSKGSSAFSRKAKEITERKSLIRDLQTKEPFKNKSKDTDKKRIVEKELQGINDDPDFQEFLTIHLNKTKKQTWTNETMIRGPEMKVDVTEKEDLTIKKVLENDDSSSSEDEEVKLSDRDNVMIKEIKEKSDLTTDGKNDLDWLKSKVVKTEAEPSLSTSNTTTEEDQRDENAADSSNSTSEDEENTVKKVSHEEVKCKTLKLRGIPFQCKEEDIIKFFKPLFIEDIRFTKNKSGKPSGYAFVDFANIEDACKAMKKDKKKIKGRFIELFPILNEDKAATNNDRKWLMKNKDLDEDVSESGRIFIRNLSFTTTEEDLESLFKTFGNLTEINLPIDKNSNKATGYAFVTFMMPEHAVKALNELDGKIFQGRILHLLPGHVKKTKDENLLEGTSAYKKKKDAEQKALSGSSHNWNALFLGQNAVADIMASRLNTNKRGILDTEASGSVAVRMALGETELVAETRDFLQSQGVKLDVFGQAISKRSKNILLVKNLPPGTLVTELKELFEKYGDLGRVLMPPFGITAILEFITNKEAKEAFSNLAYSKFKHTPLYLEWAPVDTLSGEITVKPEKEEKVETEDPVESDDDDESETGKTLFVKNLSFETTEERLKEFFTSCGKLKAVTIARKKDAKKPGILLSMGYGFIEFKRTKSVDKAIKLLQNCELDGHKLELKKSHRETIASKTSRKRASEKEQLSSKIIVRNIPFEANLKEIRDLFSTFGHIKSLRLPKKMTGTGSHRGFAFVDYTTKQDATRAFKALCQSTHLYGRRLVLEWAEDDESVDMLRQKTADQFGDIAEPHLKKKKTDLKASLDRSVATKS